MAQLVEGTQILLPRLVDDVQQHLLLELLDNRLAVALVSLLQIAGDVIHLAAVGQWHHDALVHLALRLKYLLDDGTSHLADVLGLAAEGIHHLLEGILLQLVALLVEELLVGERHLHGEDMQEFLLASLVVVVLDDVDHTVPHDIGNIHADALTHQGVAALLVDDGTLLVHHVVVLQQALTDAEVVFLDLLLGTLNLLGNHGALNHLALLEAQTVHDGGDTLGTEQTHQLVFERYEEEG